MPAIEELAPGELETWVTSRRTKPPMRQPWRVTDVLPPGYPAYLRLLHPFVAWDQFKQHRRGQGGGFSLRSWRELADEAGVPFTADIRHRDLRAATGHERGMPMWAVAEGDLDPVTRHALLAALTGSADETIYFFYGLGAVVGTDAHEQLLFRAPASAALDVVAAADARSWRPVSGPEWIWPEDRAWVVLTDYDSTSTYIGSSRAAAQRVAESDLETIELRPNEPVG